VPERPGTGHGAPFNLFIGFEIPSRERV